jgi:zinc protease
MLQHKRFPVLAIGLALTFAAYSQTLPEGVQKITSVEGITEYSLPNGMRVLLFPDNSKPKITVNMTYLVGSRHEGYGETGMAHLLEHLLFKETKAGKDVKKDLTDHGADWNGTTSYDRTNYFETVTASDENLRWAVALEADRMLNMKIEKAILDTEMTVVRNEFEIGENSPDRILGQRTLEAAYTFHNYGKSTIGNRSDIEKVPIDRLAAFYQKYYQPDNAILTVAGKFDEPKTIATVAQAFASVKRPARKLDQTYTVEPTQDGERSVTLRRVGDNKLLVAVYHGPAGSHSDAAALDVLSGILGEVPTGRLYKSLVDNKKAVAASMGYASMHDPGFIQASVRLKEDQSLDEARDIMLKAIESFTSEPPSKEEVERAKTRLTKQYELLLTNSEEVGNVLSEYAAMGDWRLIFWARDEVNKVTEADVVRVAKAYLKDSNRTLGQFIPTKSPDRAEIPATPDVAALLKDFKGGEAIQQGEVFDPSPASIEGRVSRSKLANGAKLALLPKKMRGGTVVAQVVMRFGDEKSLHGKGTIGQVAGGLLMRGTKSKSRQQIQDEIDRLKAEMNVVGGVNSATASIRTIEANLPAALRLAAEILREPAFPDSEFETVRQQRIAGIEANQSDPRALASIELIRHVNSNYTRGDVRYIGTFAEQIEELRKVTLAEVKDFHKQFYGASNAEIAISGQFDKPQIEKLAAELFGEWKSPSTFARILTPYRKVDVLDRKIETPDKQMALIAMSQTIKINDESPDYPAMVLANYMYGATPGARLFKRIREKEGLSYSVYSNFAAPTRDDGGSFGATAMTAPQNAPKAEASLKDELARTLKDGFTAEEVAAAKKAWLEERTVGRTEDGSLAGLLINRERYDRTLKFDADLEAKVAALTPQQVSEAFRRNVDAGSMIIVKAGDFKKAAVYQ